LELKKKVRKSVFNLFVFIDDAGATKVAIMLNEQVYGTESLLGEEMKHWQGPVTRIMISNFNHTHPFRK
jgi:hypothetical protein